MFMAKNRLLVFGLGYTARTLVRRLGSEWTIIGTTHDGRDDTLHFDRDHPLPDEIFAGITHALVSIPPDMSGDPVIARHRADIVALKQLRWLGYLSTTGVYGTRDGGWVDESSELQPTAERGKRRGGAGTAWHNLWRDYNGPGPIFPLPGIYWPRPRPLPPVPARPANRLYAGKQIIS